MVDGYPAAASAAGAPEGQEGVEKAPAVRESTPKSSHPPGSVQRPSPAYIAQFTVPAVQGKLLVP
jgi:hypothetical protein